MITNVAESPVRRIVFALLVAALGGCVGAPEDVNQGGASDQLSVELDPDGNPTSVSKTIQIDVVNLSSVDDFDSGATQVCDSLRYPEIYNGTFSYRARDRNATWRMATGTTTISCRLRTSFSSASSRSFIIAIIDRDDDPIENLGIAAGRATCAAGDGSCRVAYLVRGFSGSTVSVRSRGLLIQHELGHLLGMDDDYPSATIMGDLGHGAFSTTPDQRRDMYGTLLFDNPWRTPDAKQQMRDFLDSMGSSIEYDSRKLDR